ncbi:MAG TPA: hypothetical protein VKB88_22965, partial [Bryobacteraceae bacterium]|nr:hypothetical protein [Bryobacteraceae bacterium]
MIPAACVIIRDRFVRANSILMTNLSSMTPLETAMFEPVMNVLNRGAQFMVPSTRRSQLPDCTREAGLSR